MTTDYSLGKKPFRPPRSLGIGHGIFAAVLVLRLIALGRLTGSAFALPSGGDMTFYHEWARRILHGELTDHLAFYGLPLYAYYLAFIYVLFGVSSFPPALLQAICDAGTAMLLYRVSLRLFASDRNDDQLFRRLRRGQVIGISAATGWALFTPAAAYSIVLMPTAFGVFVFWFCVWQIVKRDEALSLRLSLLLGVLIGFTAMGVATVLFVTPLLLCAIWFRTLTPAVAADRWRHRGTASILVAAGIALGSAPCWLHNSFIAHDRVFLSAHSGINLWIGNNPDATGYPRFPGLRAGQAGALQDSIDIAETAAGRILQRSEISAYWSSKARDYIAHHFASWLSLVGRKIANFWNAFEYDDISVLARFRENGITFPGLHFGLVAALGLPGLWLLWHRSQRGAWIVSAVGLQLLSVLPVFVTERYRLPVVPGLLIAGGACLTEFVHAIAHRKNSLILGLTLAVASSAIAVSWPQRDPVLWALEPYNSGSQAIDAQDFPLARRKLNIAYSYAPSSAQVNFALGNLDFAEHNAAGAEVYYRRALEIDPAHVGAWNNLGLVAFDAHQWSAARDLFSKAVELAPHEAKPHFLLAKTFFVSGDFARAHEEITKALALSPQQPEFHALATEIEQRAPSLSP